jgi:hypothetical protein
MLPTRYIFRRPGGFRQFPACIHPPRAILGSSPRRVNMAGQPHPEQGLRVRESDRRRPFARKLAPDRRGPAHLRMWPCQASSPVHTRSLAGARTPSLRIRLQPNDRSSYNFPYRVKAARSAPRARPGPRPGLRSGWLGRSAPRLYGATLARASKIMAPTSYFTGQVHRLPDAPEAYGAMITRAKAAPPQSRSTDLGGPRSWDVQCRANPIGVLPLHSV